MNPTALVRYLVALTAFLFVHLGSPSLAQAASSVILAWDPNPEPEIAGYRVHYGTTSGDYTETRDAGNSTTATVSNLSSGSTHFFAVTAYNTAGLESPPSEEISFSPNEAPIAANDSIAIDEGSTSTINVLSNDADPDNAPTTLTIQSADSAANGTTSVAGNSVIYSPNPGFFGTDSFSYAITDGALTASATVTVNVQSTAKADNLLNAGLTGSSIGTATGGSRVLSDDSWEVTGAGTGVAGQADTVHFESAKQTGNFQAIVRIQSLTSGGAAPEAGLMLRESTAADARFAMLAATPGGYSYGSRTTVAAIASKAAVAAPAQFPDMWVLIERKGDAIDFATSADGVTFDFAGSALVPSLADEVDLGLFVSSGTAGVSARAVVTDFTVIESQPPAPQTGVTVNLAWDSNPEPDIAGYRVHYGTTSGDYTETLDAGDSTTATVSNLSSGSTHFFAVTAYNTAGLESPPSEEISFSPNEAPIAANDSIAIDEGSTSTINVLSNDADPDNAPTTLTIQSADSAANGTTSVAGNSVIYSPNPGFFGTDSFSYAITDGALTASATVTVNVQSTAKADNLLNAGLTGSSIGTATGGSRVLSDDSWEVTGAGTGVAGQADTVHFESAKQTGNFQAIVRIQSLTSGGAAPEAGLMLRESTAADARFAMLAATPGGYSYGSRTTVAAIASKAAVAAPAQFPDMWVLIERKGDAIDFATSTDGVTFDFAGSALVPSLADDVDLGLFVSSGTAGLSARAVVTDFTVIESQPPAPQTGVTVNLAWDSNPEPDIAGYRVHYGTTSGDYTETLDAGDSTMATVSNLSSDSTYFLVVTAYNTAGLESPPSEEVSFSLNEAPIAANDSIAMDEGSTATINVLSNDADPDNAPTTLTIQSADSAANGTTSVVGNSVIYSPNPGFFGTDSFSYAITDGALTASATVTVNVQSTAKGDNLINAGLTGSSIGAATGGSRVLSDDSWEVTGAGTGVGGMADSVHFESAKQTGNFQAIVRIQSLASGGAAPEAGLMLRESTAADARFAMLAATPNGYSYGSRTTAAGIASKAAVADPAQFPDVWVLIERIGDSIDFATSTDGVTFDFAGSTLVPSLADEVDLGLFVSSGTAGVSARAVVTDFTVIETASAPNASGLSAEYFDDMTLTNLKFSRRDATVDFSWASSSPDPALPSDHFSVRWKGKVAPRYSETYTFHTISDDGVRLWVNGSLLIDNWTNHGSTENMGSITLTAGQKYDIVMEYYENGGSAIAKLLWSSARQAKEIIPESALTPDAQGVF